MVETVISGSTVVSPSETGNTLDMALKVYREKRQIGGKAAVQTEIYG